MSQTAMNTLANIISSVTFGAALVAVLAMPSRPGGFMRNGIKMLLGGAMAIYLFVGVSHVLQFTGVTEAFDIFENYLKVLFIPLVSAAAYALRMNEQLRFTARQARVLSAEHDMLMRIVDTTPTGMVVLDAAGRFEFANDQAREILELEEDPETCTFRAPAWRCASDAHAPQGVLLGCLGTEVKRDAVCSLVWPDGTSRRLMLNATPIIAADGSAVGTVVAFTTAEVAASA